MNVTSFLKCTKSASKNSCRAKRFSASKILQIPWLRDDESQKSKMTVLLFMDEPCERKVWNCFWFLWTLFMYEAFQDCKFSTKPLWNKKKIRNQISIWRPIFEIITQLSQKKPNSFPPEQKNKKKDFPINWILFMFTSFLSFGPFFLLFTSYLTNCLMRNKKKISIKCNSTKSFSV